MKYKNKDIIELFATMLSTQSHLDSVRTIDIKGLAKSTNYDSYLLLHKIKDILNSRLYGFWEEMCQGEGVKNYYDLKESTRESGHAFMTIVFNQYMIDVYPLIKAFCNSNFEKYDDFIRCFNNSYREILPINHYILNKKQYLDVSR